MCKPTKNKSKNIVEYNIVSQTPITLNGAIAKVWKVEYLAHSNYGIVQKKKKKNRSQYSPQPQRR